MAWQTGGFRQNVYIRFLAAVESRIIIVAESPGRDLFRQNQVEELVLRLGKNKAHFVAGNLGVDLRLLRELEPLLRQK